MATWTKAEIGEGLVSGGEKIHGMDPDGKILCGATSDDGSDPWDRNIGGHFDDEVFDPTKPNSCKRCSASWSRLED